MFPPGSYFLRAAALVVFAFAALSSYGEQANAPVAPIVIEGLGKGTVPLIGPCQFHLGDDPAWATPGFNDSTWERLTADKPWGEQGHDRYTGFAWYRCHMELTPAPGLPPQFSLLLQHVDDAYEVYWNGSLIGRNGRLDSFRTWYNSQPPQVYRFGHAQRGVLAVRVWKAPLLSDDSGQRGGFEAAPELGSPEAITTAKAALDYQWLRMRQFLFAENLLYALVSLVSFLAWWRNRRRMVLFWMALFPLIPPLNLLLLNAHIRWPYGPAMGATQPLSSIQDISLWFLLLWLLLLHENRNLNRLTRIFACVSITNATIDGMLVAMSWNPRWIGPIQAADAASAFVATALEVFPLVLVGFAFSRRKCLDSTRWLVAIMAFLAQMVITVRDAVKQGRQFTNWSIASKMDSPLFTFGGSAISLYTLSGVLLLLAIIWAVYKSLREDQLRQDALEREKAELLVTQEQMRYFAEHDGLTGLLNHRIIMERLAGEMERSRREGTPLSVILADVDHFKNINDSLGHPVGDMVLREISAIFRRAVRAYDWVGRYGGEEFLIILQASEFDSACLRAEELRLAVESAHILDGVLDGDKALQVTSSFGVASGFPPDYGAEAVIQAVDAALYQAKASGRNCVIATDMIMNVQTSES